MYSCWDSRYQVSAKNLENQGLQPMIENKHFFLKNLYMVLHYTANIYSQTTALLPQKGCTLDFAMAIGGILEFAVPLLLKSHIFYY